MTKTIYLNNGVRYSFSKAAKKWSFVAKLYGRKYEILTSVNGGAEAAHKIADLMRGGLLQSRGKIFDPKVREKIKELASV